MADFIMGKRSRGVPSFLAPATVETAPFHVHWVQPARLLEITILHDFLPWYSTRFILATSLWSQYYCAHFIDRETETRKDQMVRRIK